MRFLHSEKYLQVGTSLRFEVEKSSASRHWQEARKIFGIFEFLRQNLTRVYGGGLSGVLSSISLQKYNYYNYLDNHKWINGLALFWRPARFLSNYKYSARPGEPEAELSRVALTEPATGPPLMASHHQRQFKHVPGRFS